MKLRVLGFLLRKEFLQIVRDRTLLGMLFIMPVIQLLVLANAVTFEVKSARMYVIDKDHSSMSRGVATRLAASGRFVPTESSPSMAAGDEAMLDRRVDLIVVIPEGFERGIVRDHRAPLQLVFNAEDGAAAGVMQTYANAILTSYAGELGAEVSPSVVTKLTVGDGGAPTRGSPVMELRRRGWYNSELDYREYMVPGILVVLVTMIGTLLTAMNIVREKEAGTLDQLNVTPINRSTFIAAKLIPLWTFAMIDLSVGLVVARFVFHVPILGSLVLVFFAATIYLVGALGIGLWISTVAETQQQAMFVTFSLLMVYLLMSGLFTPIRGMPVWAQWTTEINPIAHFVALMRAVLLKGARMRDVASHLAALAAISSVVLTIAIRQYHKRAA
ncbi:MAG TPA: ABC transporter permease [Gemmatimonadaceae bacterium]|nr:ABC transporter permease [Gemmatimonadaceae bacterium]